MSIEKAKLMLGYAPAHTSLQATREAVAWLNESGAFGRRLRLG